MMKMSFIFKRSENVFDLIFFLLIFVAVYFVYYYIYDSMLKKEKYTKISELVILTKKFNLDKKQMNYRSCLNGIAIINAFIISFTITIIDIIPVNIMFNLAIAFLIILILIFSMYFTYGKYLNRKWGKKNEK